MEGSNEAGGQFHYGSGSGRTGSVSSAIKHCATGNDLTNHTLPCKSLGHVRLFVEK
jgi:hypothetical protein